MLEQLTRNGVLEETNQKGVRCAHPVFGVYKSSEFYRGVYDMSTLSDSGLYSPPPFHLPNITKVNAFAARLCN